MGELKAESLLDVNERGAGRDGHGLTERARRFGAEARGERLARTPRVESGIVEPGDRALDVLAQRRERAVTPRRDNLARRDSRDLLAHSGGAGDSRRDKLAGRNVHSRQRETAFALPAFGDRKQKALFAGGEHGFFAHRSG